MFWRIFYTAFSDMNGEFVLVHLEDMLNNSKNVSKYLEQVKVVLQYFRDK